MLSGRPIGPVGDRLANAAGWAYETGAEGQRVLKSGGGNYAYLAADATGALMAEDDNGTWFDYVWLNGRLIGLTVNGGVFSLHDDQTGRPLVMTTPNTPTIAWAAVGLPLGHPWVYTNTFGNFNLGFPGQYWDSESGLWHNGNRDYNPYIGRYIESDPIGLAGGINTYAYVGDNPIMEIDPLGLCKCKGTARVLQGNASTIGKPGGFSTPNNPVDVAPGTAAVIPAQFVGGKSWLKSNRGAISGSSNGVALFSGVTEVIGGTSPIPGMNVRDALMQIYPGDLIVELPSAQKDIGVVPITLDLPDGSTCPQGTH